jgi:hypothetical protein
LTIDVITNGFGPAQHLRVEPGCCRYPGRLQRIRNGHRRLTPGQEKAGDVRRSGTESDKSGRDLVHDGWPQGRGDLRCQPGRGGWIGKSIPAGLDADHSGAERLVKQLASGLRVAARGGGELKPIEAISELCDPLKGVGHLGGQIDRRILVNLRPVTIG